MQDDRITGICPITQMGNSLYSGPRKFDVVYGGWLFQDPSYYEKSLDHIKISPFQGIKEYWTSPDINNILNHFPHRTKGYTGLIDLDADLDTIFNKIIKSKRRNMIRKAFRNNIQIDTGGPELMDRLEKLLVDTSQRINIHQRPITYYGDILRKYSPVNKAICMIAKQNQMDLSAIIFLRNSNFSSYWLGVSQSDRLNLGSGELLQWEGIKWSKENGSRYYDLCVIDKKRLPDIAKFKMGFSQLPVPFYFNNRRPILYKTIIKFKGFYHSV